MRKLIRVKACHSAIEFFAVSINSLTTTKKYSEDMPISNLCSYKGCQNSAKKSPTLSFHRFPRDQQMRWKWLIISGNESFVDLTEKQIANKRLCSVHFKEEDFSTPLNMGMKRRLNANAIPLSVISENDADSSLPVPKPESVISSLENTLLPLSPSRMVNRVADIYSEKTEPTNDLLNSSPRNETTVTAPQNPTNDENMAKRLMPYHERRLMAKIVDLRKKLKACRQVIRRREKRSQQRPLSKEEVMEAASAYLNENQLLLLKMQLYHRKPCEWSEDEKQFGLSLYHKSPRAYVFLQKNKNIKLPSVTLIRKMDQCK